MRLDIIWLYFLLYLVCLWFDVPWWVWNFIEVLSEYLCSNLVIIWIRFCGGWFWNSKNRILKFRTFLDYHQVCRRHFISFKFLLTAGLRESPCFRFLFSMKMAEALDNTAVITGHRITEPYFECIPGYTGSNNQHCIKFIF